MIPSAPVFENPPRVPERIRRIVDGWPPLDEARKARIAALLRIHN